MVKVLANVPSIQEILEVLGLAEPITIGAQIRNGSPGLSTCKTIAKAARILKSTPSIISRILKIART